ncbi:hypothetical protein [Brevibacillus sp. H7]|uniref:hypothetical protein n=1 Tax=Brevibacillus sp. H7 TaxID=3349138 RepID=UPI00380036AA
MRSRKWLSGMLAAVILWGQGETLVLADEQKQRLEYRRAELVNRLERAARFILQQQNVDGAMDESGFINTDSNMLYALMGLIAAYDRTKRTNYLAAAERGCRWLMKVQTPEGDWYLSYQKKGDMYLPALPESYREFAAIRGVDTTMALFIHVANEISKRTGDHALREQLRESSKRAYQFLLTYNLDPVDGLFWSSYQLKGEQTAWTLSDFQPYRVKYAADNAETYIGLLAAAEMFGDKEAKLRAERLKKQFIRFYDKKERLYAVMLDASGKTEMRPAYARWFANGWSAYLLREPSLFTLSRAVMAEKMNDDGRFRQWEGTYTLSTLCFLLAEQVYRVGSTKIRQAEAYLYSMQQPNGGLADEAMHTSTYVNLAGLYLLYLAKELEQQLSYGKYFRLQRLFNTCYDPFCRFESSGNI